MTARLGETTLADGRTLAWAEWGPQDGAPVLLCPGAATTRSLGFAIDALDDLGVRLVSADRPGLGASDPKPDRTLLDWPGDVRQLGLGDDLAVVGYSQGAPFALACAVAGIATRVAIVSGTDELAHPAFRDELDPMLRAMVEAPDHETFAQMEPETFWQMILEMSGDEDRAVFTEPAFAEAFRRSLDDAFAQSGDGYATDTVLAMQRWPFRVEEIDVPVHLWYGALDTSPVHSPDFGATLERRIPNATRTVREDRGGALLWTDGAEVLEALTR